MGPFTLCIAPPAGSGVEGAAAAERHLARWQALGQPLLPFGEWGLAEVRTTPADEPRLDDVLRMASRRADTPALVLIRAEAQPTPSWCDAVAELALRQPAVLAFGRAWRGDPAGGPSWLDPPANPSWVLLPRGAWPVPPHLAPDLPADPAAALPLLLELARQRHWLPLEATDAAPLSRSGPATPARTTPAWSTPPQPPIRRLSITPSSAVRLSLLLPPHAPECRDWPAQLRPSPALAWELLPCPLPDWSRAGGDLLWPLLPAAAPPPLALLPVLMRALRNPWLDGVALDGAPALLRRGLVERIGPTAFDSEVSRAHGARLLSLPLRFLSGGSRHTGDSPHPGTVSEPDPLWQAAERQLARAEGLLLAQQRRIAELEEELSRRSPTPAPSPDDRADG